MNVSRLVLFLFILCTVACQSTRKSFTKGDIRKAQKLIGLEFTTDHLSTVHDYLVRNKTGYDSLRKENPNIETAPAMVFDPRPSSYVMPKDENSYQWTPEPCLLPDTLDHLVFYTIRQLSYLIHNQDITSVQLTELFIKRIKKYDDQLNSVITLTEELAMSQAQKADEEIKSGKIRSLLHGIPYGVKDLMAVQGYPTTWGAKPYENQVLDYTAQVVQQLEEAGAVLIAKLTSGALARGDVWFGGKTKNPWDLEQGASGSSAGSGSATAAGLVAFSLGTETLGSITSPSNRCGVTGLRPTYGRVSRAGVMTLSWSMDKVGPICKTAEDCAIVFDIIRARTSSNLLTIPAPYSIEPEKDIKSLSVGYLAQDFHKDSSKSAPNRLNALQLLREMGLMLDSVNMPSSIPLNFFDIILRSESGAFFDLLVRSGEIDLMVQQGQRSRANSLRQSRFIPAVEYLQANRFRSMLIEDMHQLMLEYDIIIAPTFGSSQLLITNLTGHPVVTVPTGLDEDGHPTSITFIGKLFDEGTIISLATKFQQSTNYHLQHPPLFR